MTIEKKRLTAIDKTLIINLLNNPLVKRHMPLSLEMSDNIAYDNFISAKEAIWTAHGFGPHAYLVDGEFIGWAGIQPDGNDFEIAVVLLPTYWGHGKKSIMS